LASNPGSKFGRHSGSDLDRRRHTGIISFWAARTIRTQGTLVYLLALGVFMDGVGRLVSISQVGLPEPAALWLGYMIPELVLPFVIALTHRAALRR